MATGWARFTAAALGLTALAVAALVAFLVVLDPYDSGRLTPFPQPGVAPHGPRTANASRGRDPAFDTAIVGNSHIQLVEPARLDAQAGTRTVSLIVPATFPREQLLIIDWFLRHHAAPKAIVIGLDAHWCRADADYTEKPFPYWLYGRSDLDYLLGLVSYSVLEAIPGRIAALRRPETRARADGYWNYEPDYLRIGYGEMAHVRAKLAGDRPTRGSPLAAYPAAQRLAAVAAAMPATTALVLVRPPRHVSGVPVPGSDAARADGACLDAYRAIAESRPRTAILDWAVDRPENRIDENFFDRTHYRAPVARLVEADIAATIRRLESEAR